MFIPPFGCVWPEEIKETEIYDVDEAWDQDLYTTDLVLGTNPENQILGGWNTELYKETGVLLDYSIREPPSSIKTPRLQISNRLQISPEHCLCQAKMVD